MSFGGKTNYSKAKIKNIDLKKKEKWFLKVKLKYNA